MEIKIELPTELKFFKAELIRQKFESYFHTEEFRLLIMENNIADTYNNTLKYFSSYDKERRIDTFLYLLNASIIKTNADENYYNVVKNLIGVVLINFYSTQNIQNDYLKIVECLKKIKIIEKKDVKIIENKLASIYEKRQIDTNKLKNKLGEPQLSLDKNMMINQSINYAIITALEDDEMEKILPFINKISEVENTNNYIEIGEFKNNPEKKVVYASQHNTGMVDASILASELIIRFKPKFLIMVGVLGGKPNETNIGDVIIATKVFEVDRGKITETGFKIESSSKNISNKEVKKINRVKKDIEAHLKSIDETRTTEVRLHFGPIACVNQVIDLPEFFEESITSIDRKAIALEMESFAIVRACELLNESKTTPIIIKSVMDNTQAKTDNSKPYAAWTSAKTLEYILKNNII